MKKSIKLYRLFPGLFVFQFDFNRLLVPRLKYYIFIVVLQNYITGAEDEYVILGNTAVIKCKVPSFVTDFVSIESWISSDGQEYRHLIDRYGTYINLNIVLDECIVF